MASLAEWFEKQPRYKPKWERGSRVFGHWNKIPFIGMVVADREKDHIIIHVDLPFEFEEAVCNIIIVKHKDIKPLTTF